jgi:stress response protein YsnF
VRIITRETAAAVDGLNIARAEAAAYREGLRSGGYLLVAEVPTGAPAKQIIEILEGCIGGATDDPRDTSWGDAERGVLVELLQDARSSPEEEKPEEPEIGAPAQERLDTTGAQSDARIDEPPQALEHAATPVKEEDLRIGEREIVAGGARVRSFTRQTPAEEEVTLRDEFIEADARPSGRQVSEAEIEAQGLFKDRVFEFAEMREEPVVTKKAVIREELIVTRRVKERLETIEETLRHTEVEVDTAQPGR